MKLCDGMPNKIYRVIGIDSLGYMVKTRIYDMGLVGCNFKIIININEGPVLIELRGTRLALGRGISKKITIEEVI